MNGRVMKTGEIKSFYPTRECGYDGYVDSDGKFYYPTEIDFRNNGKIVPSANTNYVTYEQAVKMKELGFDSPCDVFVIKPLASDKSAKIDKIIRLSDFNEKLTGFGIPYPAPRIDQAHDWLISKGYFIAVEWYSETIWRYGIYKNARPAFFNNTMKPSYKEIMLSAITEALNLIERNEI